MNNFDVYDYNYLYKLLKERAELVMNLTSLKHTTTDEHYIVICDSEDIPVVKVPMTNAFKKAFIDYYEREINTKQREFQDFVASKIDKE